MKKLLIASILTILLITLFPLFGMNPSNGYAANKDFELSFTSEYMDKHPTVKNAFLPWAKEVEEMTSGRVKITYFNPNTLAPAKDSYDSTVSGLIDIGAGYCGMNPGKFLLNEAIELPMIVPSAEAGSLVTWDLYNKFPEWRNEYKEVKMLWQWASATYQLHTTKKLVKTLDDLNGMKIIGWSQQLLEILKALGASPMQIAPTDTYLALQRGMADGVLCPLAPVRSYKISDATKYHTIVDINVGPFWAGINMDLWNDLSEEIQKVFIETTGSKMAMASGKTLDMGAVEDVKWMKTQGHTFYALSDKEKDEWFASLKNMHDNWVRKMESKGYKNAGDILKEAMRLGKEYAKTTGRGYEE
ncbi:MAG: TRAP transporter substrate-binding protein [Deltaproteobacteria bacterium]|nr:TRAP transporter substrate-binding protein [Deltaproteobacteria bacterium]